MRGKPIRKGEGWVFKVICGTHNHDLYDTLVGHPYVDRLKVNEHSILVDMTKSMVKPDNILRTLKENNEDNMTTIKHVFNARYSYKRSIREPRTELQQLMMLTTIFTGVRVMSLPILLVIFFGLILML